MKSGVILRFLLVLIIITVLFNTACVPELLQSKELSQEKLLQSVTSGKESEKDISEFQDSYNLAQEEGYVDFENAELKKKEGFTSTRASYSQGNDQVTIINQKADNYEISYLTEYKVIDGKMYFIVSDRSKTIAMDITSLKQSSKPQPQEVQIVATEIKDNEIVGAFIRAFEIIPRVEAYSIQNPISYNLGDINQECVIDKFQGLSTDVFESEEFQKCVENLDNAAKGTKECFDLYKSTYDSWDQGLHDVLEGGECNVESEYDVIVLSLGFDTEPVANREFGVEIDVESIGQRSPAAVQGELKIIDEDGQQIYRMQDMPTSPGLTSGHGVGPYDLGEYNFIYEIQKIYQGQWVMETNINNADAYDSPQNLVETQETVTTNNLFVDSFNIRVPAYVQEAGINFIKINLPPRTDYDEYEIIMSDQGPPDSFNWQNVATIPATSTEYTIENLEEGKVHYVIVFLKRSSSDGEQKVPSKIMETVTRESSYIHDLVVNDVTRRGATFTWDSSGFLEDRTFSHFEIEANRLIVATNIQGTTQRVTNLDPGVQYKFKVYAISQAGEKIGISGESIATTPTTIPINLKVDDITSSDITISWDKYQKPDFSAIEVNIRDETNTVIATKEYIESSTSQHTFSHLIPGMQYQVSVDIYVTDPDEPEVLFVHETIPTETEGSMGISVELYEITRQSARFMWDSLGGSIEKYHIVKEKNGVEEIAAYIDASQVQSYDRSIGDLEKGTIYTFKIQAIVDDNIIVGEGEIQGTTLDELPLNLELLEATHEYIFVDWDKYKDHELQVFDRYDIYLNNALVATVTDLEDNMHKFMNLDHNQEYTVRVETFEYYQENSVRAGWGELTVATEATTQNLNLGVNNVGPTWIKVNWDQYNGGDFQNYGIMYWKSTDPDAGGYKYYRTINVNNQGTTSETIDDLFPNQDYTVQMLLNGVVMSDPQTVRTTIDSMDLQVYIEHSPSTVSAYSPLTFTLSITNNEQQDVTVSKVYNEYWWNLRNQGYSLAEEGEINPSTPGWITGTLPPSTTTLVFTSTNPAGGGENDGKGDWYGDFAVYTSTGVYPVIRGAQVTIV